MFASGQSTVVYATTEPKEALLLGGHTGGAGRRRTAAVRANGRGVPPAPIDPRRARLQRPADESGGRQRRRERRAAARWRGSCRLRCLATRSETLTVGVRAGALQGALAGGDLALPGKVELAEIAGSDTFVHVRTSIGELVAQLTGVHVFSLGAAVTLYLNPAAVYVFDAAGDLLVAPAAMLTAQRWKWPHRTRSGARLRAESAAR